MDDLGKQADIPAATGGLRLGSVQIEAPFYQAGLAGYSDTAMRLIARRHGCPFCVTEALLDQFLIAGGKGLKAAELDEADHPIAGQLMGSHPEDIAAGAKVLVGLGYDLIDVNLACPVKKIKKKARGGHLLSEPDQAIAILDAVMQSVGSDVPVTTKLRRAYDDTKEHAAGFDQVFESAMQLGLSGATVHTRTVQQKYLGPGRRSFLRELVDRYDLSNNPDFTLGGSGDVWTAQDIFIMLEDSGIDWVSVARGCIGNPWVFEQARGAMQGDPKALTRPPTIFQQRDVLLAHLDLSLALHGEHLASRMMRKFGIRFARHHPNYDAIKADFIQCECLMHWHQVIEKHYDTDGPGVDTQTSMPEEAKTQQDTSSCEPATAQATEEACP